MNGHLHYFDFINSTVFVNLFITIYKLTNEHNMCVCDERKILLAYVQFVKHLFLCTIVDVSLSEMYYQTKRMPHSDTAC